MSANDINNLDAQTPSGRAINTHAQEEIDNLLVRMHETADPDELVLMAERLKVLAMQPADELHTFAEEDLPDWAIHEEDQEELNAFFNEPADRGNADTTFAIPRGAADFVDVSSYKQAAEPTVEPMRETEQVKEPEQAQEPEQTQEPKQTHESEQKSSSEPVTRPEAKKESDTVSEPESPKMAETEPQHHSQDHAPRRSDFANFRCIYESQDGQLALYEDEHGHLTAVNTNHFA